MGNFHSEPVTLQDIANYHRQNNDITTQCMTSYSPQSSHQIIQLIMDILQQHHIHSWHQCGFKIPVPLGTWSERLRRWHDYGEIYGGEDRTYDVFPDLHFRHRDREYLVFVDDLTLITNTGETGDRVSYRLTEELIHATGYLITHGYTVIRFGNDAHVDRTIITIALNEAITKNARLVCFPLTYQWLKSSQYG